MTETVAEIRRMLRAADAAEFAAIERALAADARKGVIEALDIARRRLEAQAAEDLRLRSLYAFDRSFFPDGVNGVVVGLDEVGRGSVAGPLAVGAVVLPASPEIKGLDDSKRLAPDDRETVASDVKRLALAWTVSYVDARFIDSNGMAASLRKAFSEALSSIEESGIEPDVVLVDGNPLGIDRREHNVVKGDSKSASIAAASIVAKVTRDGLMRSLDSTYPQYGFASNKGYASTEHVAAIRRYGVSPVHRASFCRSFMQETLF